LPYNTPFSKVFVLALLANIESSYYKGLKGPIVYLHLSFDPNFLPYDFLIGLCRENFSVFYEASRAGAWQGKL
jgi:hypothetical protein